MKKSWVLVLTAALAASAAAQRGATSSGQTSGPKAIPTVIGMGKLVDAPTHGQVYCSGYITNQPVQELGYVAGGWNTPNTRNYGSFDYVYVSGAGFEVGKEYQIIRRAGNLYPKEYYKGQRSDVKKAGATYFEIGRVKVLDIRDKIAITQVQLACDGINPGDLAIPQPEKTIPRYHGPMQFDRFAPPNGKLTGRIIAAKEFDQILGDNHVVYLSVGEGDGVKIGDYFRVTRTYEQTRKDETDGISFRGIIPDPTQYKPKELPKHEVKDLPRRSLGEMIIVHVTPRSATGVITFALEDMYVGDMVELMDVPPPVEPAAEAQPMAPSISCYASPNSVRAGESATIICDGQSPDNRPLTYGFMADRGTLAPRENTAVLGTANTGAGPIAVTATVTDDRNMSASTVTNVNVEAMPQAPQPSLMGEAMFRKGSAYVDNRAKAMLDGVALRLQQEPDARLLVVGFADAGESPRLAQRRADNVKAYLVKNKGIDAGRIETRTGTGAGSKAEAWLIPGGAQMP